MFPVCNNYALKNKITLFLSTVLALLLCGLPLYSVDYENLDVFSVRNIDIYHHQRDNKIVQQLVDYIHQDIDEFQRAIGFYPDIETKIVVAPDKEFYRNLVSDYAGVIEFSEAFYSGKDGKIYIRNLRDLSQLNRLRTTVLHEYIHHFIDSFYESVPLWFHEGMAVFFSGDLGFDRELTFAKDFLLGNTQPLSEMVNNYPSSRVRWGAFYTKSALAMKYLYSRHTEEFYRFWDLAEETSNFERAFITAFNMTPKMFSHHFDEHIDKRFKTEILLSFTGILWSMFPLFLIIAWLRKKIIAHNIKKKWDETGSDSG